MVVCVLKTAACQEEARWVGGGEIGGREMIQSLHIAPSFFVPSFSLFLSL